MQSGSRKLRPANYYRKLLSEDVCKAAPESCSPKLLFFQQLFDKVVPESWPKLYSPKRFPKVACQNYTRMHLYKVIAPKLLCFKPIPQSGSSKLFSRAAPKSSISNANCQSCPPKPRFFKIVVQTCRAKLLLKIAPVP